MKTVIVTIFYLAGAFSIGFDSNGNPFANNAYWVSQIERNTAARVVIAKQIRRSDFASELNTLSGWRYQKWARIKAFIKRQKAQGIKLLYFPPLVERDGIRYIAGLADVCRPKDGVAAVWANDYNQDGKERILNIQCTAAHEIGHNLGARHDDNLPATVMHSAGCTPNFIYPSIDFSSRSRIEMKKCMSAWGRYDVRKG